MAKVTVNYQVFMTHSHIGSKEISVGTDGLGPCVGIIAILKNGKIFCGHLACEVTPMLANKQTVYDKTKTLLLKILGSKEDVEVIYCATSSLSGNVNTGNWMIQSMTEIYSKVSYAAGTGIYWDKQKPVVIQFGTELEGTTKGPKDYNGPLELKN